MDDVDRKGWRKITLRLDHDHHQILDDLAHAARLPVGVYCRELLLNRTPKAAPPALLELSPAAQKLLLVLQNLTSNSRQVEAFAAAAGEPLCRLAGPEQLLQKLATRAREIGMQLKTAGQLIDQQKIDEILTAVAAPAQRLNDELSRPLNQSQAVTLETWKSVLQDLQIGLADSQNDGENHG